MYVIVCTGVCVCMGDSVRVMCGSECECECECVCLCVCVCVCDVFFLYCVLVGYSYSIRVFYTVFIRMT